MNNSGGGRQLLNLYRVLRDEEAFSRGEKSLLYELVGYMNERTFECFPGETLLARKLKTTEKTVRKDMIFLQEKGAIQRMRREHGYSIKILWAERAATQSQAAQAEKSAGKQPQRSDAENLQTTNQDTLTPEEYTEFESGSSFFEELEDGKMVEGTLEGASPLTRSQEEERQAAIAHLSSTNLKLPWHRALKYGISHGLTELEIRKCWYRGPDNSMSR